MSLTKEQLLIPRVMCVGTKEGTQNFPGSDYMTGTILEPDGKDAKGIYYYRLKNRLFIYIDEVENYPNCFRPMPWWEGRKPVDMPQYVKFTEDYMSFKSGSVYKWEHWTDELEVVQFRVGYHENDRSGVPFGKWVEPATEQEYWDSKPLRKCPDCESTWKGDERCPECFPI